METALAFVVGLALGGAVAWYASQRGDRRSAAKLEETRGELGEAREKLARVEADHAARREELEKAREQLDTHFKGIASQVVRSSNEEFLKQAREQFERQSETADKSLGARERAVRELVKPVKEKLDTFDEHVRDLERKRSGAYAQVNELIDQTQKQLDRLRTETGGLREALHSSQVRGSWGEQELRNVIEAAGVREPVDFVAQETTATDTGSLRPDLVVNIPGGVRVVVDAKTPFESYFAARNAESDDERKELLQKHASSLLGHAHTLAGKDYDRWVKGSPDFVVMFVGADGILEAAQQAQPSIWEDAWSRHRVLIATPGLLIAFLRTVALAWQREDIQRNAQEIADTARELYSRLKVYAGHVDDLGKGLKRAVDAYNRSVGAFQSRVLVQARRIEDLGAVPDSNRIADSEPVELDVRSLSSPDVQRTLPAKTDETSE